MRLVSVLKEEDFCPLHYERYPTGVHSISPQEYFHSSLEFVIFFRRHFYLFICFKK